MDDPHIGRLIKNQFSRDIPDTDFAGYPAWPDTGFPDWPDIGYPDWPDTGYPDNFLLLIKEIFEEKNVFKLN